MKDLSIDQINSRAPYDVCRDRSGAILFCTDYEVEYSVTFDDDANPYFTAYWFNLSNMNSRTSPGDPKVAGRRKAGTTGASFPSLVQRRRATETLRLAIN